jgi:hypothetical protein
MNRRSQQSKPTFAALLLVMALGACTIVNEHRAPPSDWPVLEVIVEEHGFWGTQEKCGRNVAEVVLIGPMLACAWVNFDEMTCRIYLWMTSALGHELLHCKGYDHYISNALADYWNEWKQSQRVAEK